MQYHGQTVSPVEFMQEYLGDHSKRCSKCGYEGSVRTDWDAQKRDDEGLHFHNVCPKCGATEDINFRSHREE